MISISKEKLEKKLKLLKAKAEAYKKISNLLRSESENHDKDPMYRSVCLSVYEMASNNLRMIEMAIATTDAELAETE